MRKTKILTQFDHKWFWRSRLPERKDQECRILIRGKMNSILVEFRDGYRVVTSRFAVRKIVPIIILILASLACMTTIPEEVGTAAPGTAPSPTESQPSDPPGKENPAGDVFEIPAEWAEPSGYQLCAVVTASQSLHLRSEPNEHSQILEWLLAGEQVEVYDPTGYWWGVETISGKRGYARREYLQEEKCQD